MSSAPVPRLELLIPWELPTEQPLSAADQARIGRALHSLLEALREPDAVALSRITQALEQLGPIGSTPSELSSTKTALQQPQIADFDHYFEAVHVQTSDPVGCLVQSLLLTYQRVLQLWLSGDFNPQQIAYQKQGFVSYGYLLLRVSQLPDPGTRNH
ncbi:hypothetical protein HJG54_28345 [Leptolyngbya sp. NK1-12]|uniref:Uncharacterized protein n=1 Tax=Leptolyngbya sp. NK1-12 TaxID=2547451 RepID=A0AA97AS29_9CYAN|nr:hypothetical protein [Leptolyngbya sp. NK1-12]WNZ26343.1 hypothetical protein HJG54_28345 [Leptolyngbya sp. NK1-12]